PVQTATWAKRDVGALRIETGDQELVAGSYRPPTPISPSGSSRPQTIMWVPVQTALWGELMDGWRSTARRRQVSAGSQPLAVSILSTPRRPRLDRSAFPSCAGTKFDSWNSRDVSAHQSSQVIGRVPRS